MKCSNGVIGENLGDGKQAIQTGLVAALGRCTGEDLEQAVIINGTQENCSRFDPELSVCVELTVYRNIRMCIGLP